MSTSLFTFEWPQKVSESVYVTGTFDNWSKSTKLLQDKSGLYTATIEVPKEKIIFKYVVDGNWLTTSKFKIELDSTGIENNVIYPEDLNLYNEDLKSTINENYTSFDPLSPHLNSSTEYDTNQIINDGSNSNNVNYRSDTDTSAFTNISVGDISPFESSDNDNRQNPVDNRIYQEYESLRSIESDDDLYASTQGTLMGVETPRNGSCSNSINQQKNLVSLPNNNGSREVRYYTSMSVLDRFKKYFK